MSRAILPVSRGGQDERRETGVADALMCSRSPVSRTRHIHTYIHTYIHATCWFACVQRAGTARSCLIGPFVRCHTRLSAAMRARSLVCTRSRNYLQIDRCVYFEKDTCNGNDLVGEVRFRKLGIGNDWRESRACPIRYWNPPIIYFTRLITTVLTSWNHSTTKINGRVYVISFLSWNFQLPFCRKKFVGSIETLTI